MERVDGDQKEVEDGKNAARSPDVETLKGDRTEVALLQNEEPGDDESANGEEDVYAEAARYMR